MKYFELLTTKTGSSLGKGDYSCFDFTRETFASMAEVKAHLSETYGNCKRKKVYRDTAEGESIQVGYIYCFNNADLSYSPVDRWHQRDWVEIREINASVVIL